MLRKLFFLFGLCLVSTTAFGARWNILGGVNMARPDADGFSEHLSYGGGILPEFMLGKMTGLEIGALFMTRKTSYSLAVETYPGRTEQATTSLEINAVEVPLVFRFWLARAISIGLGGYYGIAVGDASVSTKIGNTSYTSTSPASGSDYGAIGNIRLDIPFGKSFGFVIDGRYLYGLSSDKWRVIEGLAGFRFGEG
ncbi:MAG: outer membrane beta-barrel protein [Bacteriovoracia bacterium]